MSVIISWLGRRDIFQLFEDDSQGSDKDIQEIKVLLDEDRIKQEQR
ncbi:MAG TPA: hypothetical protein VFZ48_03660 [Candidatus Saccharimonadales bacterium]